MSTKFAAPAAALACLALSACSHGPPPDVMSKKSPVELRAMQTRDFEMGDQNKMLRGIVATLQDNGYTIEKVEPPAGTVTATKFAILHLSATATPHGSTRTSVRANAMVAVGANTQVDDPQFYEKLFFEPLSKTIFLSALQSDDTPVSDADKVLGPTKQASAEGKPSVNN